MNFFAYRYGKHLACDSDFDESKVRRTPKGKGGGQFAKKPETLAKEDQRDDLNKSESGESDSSAALDAEYMDAVKSGDMDKAQRMVDDVARAKGYTIKGFKGIGTKELITSPNGDANGVHWFTNKESVARSYAKWDGYDGRVDAYYLREDPGRPYILSVATRGQKGAKLHREDIHWQRGVQGEWTKKFGKKRFVSTNDVAGFIKNLSWKGNGVGDWHLGVKFPGIVDTLFTEHLDEFESDFMSDVYGLFSANDSKLANPVNLDDDGNIIPLSKRFDLTNPDIRY